MNKSFKKMLLITMLSALFGQAMAGDKVLVMTISDYSGQPLDGVKHDANNALTLAKSLGYDTSQATVLKDGQLTAAGMREAMQGFSKSVQQGDRVFVYYSGHGASFKKNSACVQGLVSQDGEYIETSEQIQYLTEAKAKISDALVIYDACHAGGNRDIAVSRSLEKSKKTSKVSAKVWVPKSGEACDSPVNMLAKSWTMSRGAKGMFNPENNFTFIAAANEKQIALDSSRGGLATVGLLACAKKGAIDNDSSSSVSVSELAACAQQQVAQSVTEINEKNANDSSVTKIYTPQTIEVYGNTQKTIGVNSLANGNISTDKATQVISAFRSYEGNSNGNWGFSAEPSSNAIKIGQDFNIRYKSDQPGYIYMLYVGSDRKEMMQVWPEAGQHIRINAGENVTPTLEMQGPPGENTVLMVVSQTPMNFDSLLNKDGVATINNQSLSDMNCLMQAQRNIKLKENSECASSSKRNIALKKDQPALGQVTGYAARVLIIKGF